MALVKVEIEVPKESKELLDAVFVLVRHFKDGGDINGAAAFLPAILAGIEGVDKLPEELKGPNVKGLASYGVEKIWEVFA